MERWFLIQTSYNNNVMCPINKVANNILFICKKYYVQVSLEELGLLSATSNTYQQVNDVTAPLQIVTCIV